MSRPVLLDLFCGAGGCAVGYHRAGFDVVGVDNRPQPRYPFEFVQADALEYLAAHGPEYDAIHASPPCQRYSQAGHIRGVAGHADLVGPARQLLQASGKPWVIENVPGSPLNFPAEVCGLRLGLRVKRHRWFEGSVLLLGTGCEGHRRKDWVTVFGSGAAKGLCSDGIKRRVATTDVSRAAMGIGWMSRAELSQAIPPAYTEFVGRQLIEVVTHTEAQDG